jgi:hypothetical protein
MTKASNRSRFEPHWKPTVLSHNRALLSLQSAMRKDPFYSPSRATAIRNGINQKSITKKEFAVDDEIWLGIITA